MVNQRLNEKDSYVVVSQIVTPHALSVNKKKDAPVFLDEKKETSPTEILTLLPTT